MPCLRWGRASCYAVDTVSYRRFRASSRAPQPTALTVVGIALLVVSATIFGTHFLGSGRVGAKLSSASLPPDVAPTLTMSATRSAEPSREPGAVPALEQAADKPGVPVRLTVADHQVETAVSADRLNADGSLYVPSDPRAVSWSSQDVGPGSSFGTTILVGHVNYAGARGVFSDLADYKVGQAVTVLLADGRTMKYAVAAPPIEVDKNKLGPRRAELFDQSHSYGPSGKPRSGRLLLLSCGGTFDNRTGHYQSNIFVFALPV